jgi:hypothetical protein
MLDLRKARRRGLFSQVRGGMTIVVGAASVLGPAAGVRMRSGTSAAGASAVSQLLLNREDA